MGKSFIYLLFIFLIVCGNTVAQQFEIDSLLKVVKITKQDTTKVNAYNDLFLKYEFNNDQKAKEYLEKALLLSQRINFKKGLSITYLYFGYFSEDKGNLSEALTNYNSSLKIAKSVRYKKGIADAQNSIGTIYKMQGNYPEALKNYYAALKIYKSLKIKNKIAGSYNNIGLICYNQSNYSEALKNHFASLKLKKEIGDNSAIAGSYNNIGIVYQNIKDYSNSLKFHQYALKICDELEDEIGKENSYANMGIVYTELGNYFEALNNHFAELKIAEGIGDKTAMARAFNHIGSVFLKQKKIKEAEEYLFKGLRLSKEIGYLKCLTYSYRAIAVLDSIKGDFKSSLRNYKSYIVCRDSLSNEQSQNKLIQSKMNFEFSQKEELAKAIQNKKDVIARQTIQQKEHQLNYIVIVLIVVALFTLLILKGFRQKQKANVTITHQKNEVEKSKSIIEEKNIAITDSINYAKRIQNAMLPNIQDIESVFPDSFVLFKPKDIVSGDFFFFNQNDSTIIIAAADCTGHGIPGAFMSTIGTVKLAEAVAENNNTSSILASLNKGIKTVLKQTDGDSSTRDGMDIALCSIDTTHRILKFSGANRPLWIIRYGQMEVEEIKGTKMAIGGLTEDNYHFDTIELHLYQGDTIYICTDGFADLFNGQDGKKLMTKKLKEILVRVQYLSMKEQEKYLENFMENWIAGTEQIDDVLMIGIRF